MLLIGLAPIVVAPKLASAEEPAQVDPTYECDRSADFFDLANAECSGAEICVDLPVNAVDRTFRGRTHAKCASRYDDFLELAHACQLELDSDLLFSTQMTMLNHRVSAYECTHNYERDVKPTLVRLGQEIAALRDSADESAAEHLQQLVDLRRELSRIEPPQEQPEVIAPAPITTKAEIEQQPATTRPLRLIDHFTLRANVGMAQVLGLLILEPKESKESKGVSKFSSNLAMALSVSAGARFPLGEARRHLLGLGLTYTFMGGHLSLRDGPDSWELATESFPGIHHLGPYTRYGYRVHRDHFTPYLELSLGLQGFSFGGQFLTSFGHGKLGICSLWQVLCLEAGYIRGWGGPAKIKTSRAIAWSISLGVDLLRMASVKRARSNDT